MPFKAFNQEHAKLYYCIHKLPEDPQEYNWICPTCFEFLCLIKFKIDSKVKYYFLHEKDVKDFVNILKNKSI